MTGDSGGLPAKRPRSGRCAAAAAAIVIAVGTAHAGADSGSARAPSSRSQLRATILDSTSGEIVPEAAICAAKRGGTARGATMRGAHGRVVCSLPAPGADAVGSPGTELEFAL